MNENQILNILPVEVRKIIKESKVEFKHLQEIRIRINQKPMMIVGGEEVCLIRSGRITECEVKEMLEYISRYSLFAYEQEVKQGFITVEGGHRVGLVGKAIVEGGKVKNLKYISSLNIRVSHEVIGCGEGLIPYLVEDYKLCHTLLISPPRCGKTTILRDIIRMASDGNAYIRGGSVGVVDERSEIGGCYMGTPQNYLGSRTDILDACPKVEGMMMLVRSMSPEVIAIDEIGLEEDIQALEYVIHCGCQILSTVHGGGMKEIRQKPVLSKLIEKKIFQRYVVLTNEPKVGSIGGVYDGDGNLLYQDVG